MELCGWVVLCLASQPNRFTNTHSLIERDLPQVDASLIPEDKLPGTTQHGGTSEPGFVFSIFIYRNISFSYDCVGSGWVIIYSKEDSNQSNNQEGHQRTYH